MLFHFPTPKKPPKRLPHRAIAFLLHFVSMEEDCSYAEEKLYKFYMNFMLLLTPLRHNCQISTMELNAKHVNVELFFKNGFNFSNIS